MVGVGESDEEVVEAMQLLRGVGVELITLGQYLQPSWKHLAVDFLSRKLSLSGIKPREKWDSLRLLVDR